MIKTIETPKGKRHLDENQQWIDVYVVLEVEIEDDVIMIQRRPTHDRVDLPDSFHGINRHLSRNNNRKDGEIVYAYDPRDFPSSGLMTPYCKRGDLWITEATGFLRGHLPEFNKGSIEHKACEALEQAEHLFPTLAAILEEVYTFYSG